MLILCSPQKAEEYVPIVKTRDAITMAFLIPKDITTSEKEVRYVGSKEVGFVRIEAQWREVSISNFKDIPIVCEAKEFKAYEDPDNKYLLFLANFGKATGNQDELSAWLESNSMLGSSSAHYSLESIESLLKRNYGFIGKDTVFNGITPVGCDFYLNVYRTDSEAPEFGMNDNNNLLRGRIFEYAGKRYGIMYMRYNATWDIDLNALFYAWTPQRTTENEAIKQIINSPSMNKNEDIPPENISSGKQKDSPLTDKANSKKSTLTDFDLQPYAGTYTPCSYVDDGTTVTDIILSNNGIITGSMSTSYGYGKSWAGTKPVSITKNDDGSITCEIIQTEEYHEYYIIYPVGINDHGDIFDKNKTRIEYIIADGGILGYTYYKLS